MNGATTGATNGAANEAPSQEELSTDPESEDQASTPELESASNTSGSSPDQQAAHELGRRTFRQKVEDNVTIWLLSMLAAGFVAALGAVRAGHEFYQLDSVREDEYLMKEDVDRDYVLRSDVASLLANNGEAPGEPAVAKFTAAGTFSEGSLLKSINTHFAGEDDSPLYVVADLAGYGALSHPGAFSSYIEAIKRRAQDSLVQCVFLSPKRKREILEAQFKDFEKNKINLLGKLSVFTGSGYGRTALLHLRKEGRDIDPSNCTAQDMIDLLLEADQLVIDELLNSGVEVFTFPHLIAVHLWKAQELEAIISLVDFKGIVEERGFQGTQQMAETIQEIFEQVRKESDRALPGNHDHVRVAEERVTPAPPLGM